MNVQVANSKLSDVSFTNDQKVAVEGIIEFINAPFNPNKYIVGLCGPGGVGKTFVTNYIIENCKYSSSVIKCASPTHKACRVLSQAIGGRKVETIQSLFGFRLDLKLEDFNPDRPQFNPKAKPKLEQAKLLIIDESSMLPAGIVTYVTKTCRDQQIKLIFVGDASQLPPVNQRKSIAFDICSKVFYLNEIVRQEIDNPIRDLLQILREDISNKTFNFLHYISRHVGESIFNEDEEGYLITNPVGFKSLVDMSFNDEEFTRNVDKYRMIAYTNIAVSNWNTYIRNKIIKDADKSMLTKNDLIMSNETIVDDFLSTIIINSEEYIVHDIVNYVDNKYGFKGFMVKFQMIHGGRITQPIFVIDAKDIASIKLYDSILSELKKAAFNATGGTRVSKWKEYYDFKKKYLIPCNILNRDKSIKVQASISYGFALTSHKAQGSTYDVVFVDINDMVYTKDGKMYTNADEMLRRLYVGCSRARKQLILCYGK